MRRNFKIRGIHITDPRVAMRLVIGTLLVANLAAAIVAFHPFGGGPDDLRREQQSLTAQLAQLRGRIASSKVLVDKVQTARTQGDKFLDEYFTDTPTTSAIILSELTELAKQANIRMGTAQWNRDPIEGSDTLVMLTTQVGFDGTYASLTKFINLLDKSPRFMIIESLQAAAPQQQGGQSLNVTLKIDTFVKEAPGAAL
jgi:type IV pilus assembly protein PilO